MTEKEASTLATEIAKNSNGVSIKQGRTNGLNCLHLNKRGSAQGTTTIYSRSEWESHPENTRNRRKPRKQREQVAA